MRVEKTSLSQIEEDTKNTLVPYEHLPKGLAEIFPKDTLLPKEEILPSFTSDPLIKKNFLDLFSTFDKSQSITEERIDIMEIETKQLENSLQALNEHLEKLKKQKESTATWSAFQTVSDCMQIASTAVFAIAGGSPVVAALLGTSGALAGFNALMSRLGGFEAIEKNHPTAAVVLETTTRSLSLILGLAGMGSSAAATTAANWVQNLQTVSQEALGVTSGLTTAIHGISEGKLAGQKAQEIPLQEDLSTKRAHHKESTESLLSSMDNNRIFIEILTQILSKQQEILQTATSLK